MTPSPTRRCRGRGPRCAADATARDDDGDEATELAGDLDELVRTAAQRDEYLALAQRTQADFENYRKRVAREAAAAQERGCATLAKELLPALDNLDRALEAAAADDPLLEGVRLVQGGAERRPRRGRASSPSRPWARCSTRPCTRRWRRSPSRPGGKPSGTVVEVYQPGYRLGKNIIRPARVVVAA